MSSRARKLGEAIRIHATGLMCGDGHKNDFVWIVVATPEADAKGDFHNVFVTTNLDDPDLKGLEAVLAEYRSRTTS
jgi:hypothetical protein